MRIKILGRSLPKCAPISTPRTNVAGKMTNAAWRLNVTPCSAKHFDEPTLNNALNLPTR